MNNTFNAIVGQSGGPTCAINATLSGVVRACLESKDDLDKINIGCKVKILDVEFNEELEYKIVGSTEANSLKGKISNESPVGEAILGKKKGDDVDVQTPGCVVKYQIKDIKIPQK